MAAPKLNNIDKAAILLIGLGEEISAELFKHLPPEDIKRLLIAMQRLPQVDQRTATQIFKDFQQLLQHPPSQRGLDGKLVAQNMLRNVLKSNPELADHVLQGQAELTAVANVEPQVLHTILQKEQPQTIALVLAHMSPLQAAQTLKLFPTLQRPDIVMRISKLEPVDPEQIEDLNDYLAQEILKIGRKGKQPIGGADKVAAILNAMDRASEAQILTAIAERHPELEATIRGLMFTFDDLVKLQDRDLREVLKAVPANKWVVALRDASETLKAVIFKNMSPRAAQLLQEDIQVGGKVKRSEVEKTQQDIIKTVMELAEAGKINISRSDDEYV